MKTLTHPYALPSRYPHLDARLGVQPLSLLHRPQTLLQELPPVFIRSPGRQSQQQNCQPQNQSRNIFFAPTTTTFPGRTLCD